MGNSMKAAVVHELGKPLGLEEVPVPQPNENQVLVRIAATGICHTDLHAAKGDCPVKPQTPFIPGHEGVGTVAAVGRAARGVKEGDRVGIPWLHTARGHCPHSRTGWETLSGAHGALVTAESPKAFEQAFDRLRSRGTMALVGLPPRKMSPPIFDMVLKRITSRGSIFGTRQDLDEALAFAGSGSVSAHFSWNSLESLNDIFARMEDGKIDGRIVANLQ
ncbi:alcohol dehydrogenase catalytic domain-containing protein [Accumulibacter sp.]|uniref:alcohol dehydrogenase catalytic domain-containing protein n=1 Tax=Accumulibacter sp. TaxID=2053492 RepID=UPI001AC0EC08|nr:alcohol dehydrogenase catalytic domain-containing protein [Accumulibacter sp.]MBN8443747.1 alcohol dehydrogenase catalytic domain-containing protein [Thauera sp.]MBN8499253.1 alcohol dehydrogenase catalytic domain-containing protein [Accumulibacter sp.]MBO3713528.1 alcohol dehydrogenase catalytic domain-containing protein [Accumulibacter sp.]